MSDNFTTFLSVAWEAASAAGEIIRAKWHEPRAIEYKGAIDLVTSVDRESEQKIVEILRQNFPDHGFLAEEGMTTAGESGEYRWTIDPLDGTTNFAHSYPHVAVSIALEKSAEVLLGLVYDPLRRECFRASKGQGATLNGVPIHPSAIGELDKSLLATGFPYDRRDNADQYLAFFKAFLTRCQGIRRNGSAALDLCYVASGRLDGFWALNLKPGDVTAGALIVTEAGGSMSDFSGERFSIDGNETLASNGVIHPEMIDVLSSVAGLHVD